MNSPRLAGRALTPVLRGTTLALLLAQPALAETDLIAGDTLSLRVMDWDPVAAEIRDWPAMAGEMTVREDGTISVPFLGAVEAVGRSPEELSADVSRAIGQRFALSVPPEATIVRLAPQPVIVGGLVERPGEVLWRQGLTVRHAIALAGGMRAVLSPGSDGFRDLVGTDGRIRLLHQRQLRLEAELARLDAQREGAVELEDVAQTDDATVQRLYADEAEVMARARQRLETERTALADQTALLTAEVASLEQVAISLERQREQAVEARANAERLANNGLVVNDRLLESDRDLVRIETQILDTSTRTLRARQQLTATQRELDTIEDLARTGVVTQQMDVRAALDDVTQEIATLSRQAELQGVVADRALSEETTSVNPGYRVIRADGSAMVADLSTPLFPGDLVEIELP